MELAINRVTKSEEIYREKIIEGAYSCLEQHGFDKTTAGDIIDRSGVSRAMFYQLFKNKEAVFIQICHREIGAYSDTIDGLWKQKNKTAADIVAEFIFTILKEAQKNMYLRYIAESPDYMTLILESQSSDTTIYSLMRSRWERAFQPLIERSQNAAVSIDDVVCWLTFSQVVITNMIDITKLSDAELKKFIRGFVATPLTQSLNAT